MAFFRGYNPLILTFDPNFLGHSHFSNHLPEAEYFHKSCWWMFGLMFRHENTSFKFTFFGAQRLDQYTYKIFRIDIAPLGEDSNFI